MNEGFATLYENHLTDLVYPGERWLDTFLIDTVQPVMEVDANPNIRPMTFYVEDPEQIEFLFDNVAYSKCETASIFKRRSLRVSFFRSWQRAENVPKCVRRRHVESRAESLSHHEKFIA